MCRLFHHATCMALLCLLTSFPGAAAELELPSGRQIMQWVTDRDEGDNETSNLEMILIDKRGNKRIREMRSMRKEKGEDRMTLLFFSSPADVKNTGFLSYDYVEADRDDDQWLYLPALKKTKRIAGGDKSGRFMGSDFTYSDMSKPALDRYTYTLMKETEINGVPVWQVEAIPNEKEVKETGYTRSINFVRKDNYVVVRTIAFIKKGKRLKYMSVENLEQIDGVWVATEISMTTKKGKQTHHKTILRISNIQFNQPLKEQNFTVRQLEKGI